MMLIKKVMLLLVTLSLPFFTFAEQPLNKKTSKEVSNFVYGVGAFVNQEVYKGYSTRKMLIPFLGYKGDNLTVFGPLISYKVKEFKDVTVSIRLSPRFQGFDESDSDTFQGMKDRRNSIDAGIGLYYKVNDWKFSFSSMYDVLNRSQGFELKSTFGRTFRYGPIFIEPTVSLSYLNANHVDYYYGVSADEVTASRLAYKGSKAQNTSIGLSAATPIFFDGFTRLVFEYVLLDSAISNSPLVEDSSSLSVQLFFTKNF